LAILNNGNPAISYYDGTNGDLKFAYSSTVNGAAATWTIVIVDNIGIIGEYTSLAILSNGNPAISYCTISADLKFAYSSTVNGALNTWTIVDVVPSTVTDGQYTSLAILSNGNPAISYWDIQNSDLKFAYSSTVNGALNTWTIVTVDPSVANVGFYTSLAILNNGNPAISYYDGTNGDLKFAYSSTVNGAIGTWSSATVDSAGTVGQYTSLAILNNGNPAISYYDTTNADLKFLSLGFYKINYIATLY
jgi:hypothetical protein